MAEYRDSRFTITPHRSMADETFEHFILMGSALGVIVDIVMFALAGPLVGLLVAGNAVFLILALVIHQRGRATETVRVDPSGIEIIWADSRGRERRRKKVSGLRLTIRRRPAGADRSGWIAIGSGATCISIGKELTGEEMESFWPAFRAAVTAAGLGRALADQPSPTERPAALPIQNP